MNKSVRSTSLLFLFTAFMFLAANAQDKTRIQKTNLIGLNDLALDAAGNSYRTGTFNGKITFGAVTLSSETLDFYIVKYDPAGKVIWAQKAGSPANETPKGIAVDAAGNNIFITGLLGNTGNGTSSMEALSFSNPSGRNRDIFLMKFDATGNRVWTQKVAGKHDEYVSGLSLDAAGNCYITGDFNAAADFGQTKLVSKGFGDIFIAKYDVAGKLVWARSAGGRSNDNGYGIYTDAAGNSYITGYFQGPATFGNELIRGKSNLDVYVAKYDKDGNMLWVRFEGGQGSDEGRYITADASGNCYVTGVIKVKTNFGATQLGCNGPADIFVAKYDASGNLAWAINGGGSGADEPEGIVVDDAGNCYVKASFQGTAAMGSKTLTSSKGSGSFVANLDPKGKVVWLKNPGE